MTPSREQVELAAYQVWQLRGGGHGGDVEDWLAAEDHLELDLNYQVIVYHPLGSGRLFVGDRQHRVCRYCHRGSRKTTFKKIAHTIPEFLGNRCLISHDECDKCNHYIGTVLEDNLSKMLLPITAFFGIKGKKGTPTHCTFRNFIHSAHEDASAVTGE